jgi:uncharacterized membrane protein YkvA (DUF1232 family)
MTLAAATVLLLYVATIGGLVVAGRGSDARAFARFVPDCAVLLKRLLSDPRVPRSHKVLVGLLLLYLASPIDLVPDIIPVVGQLDDALLVALVLRGVLRAGGETVLCEQWPGSEQSLRALRRLAFGAPSP